MSKYLDPRSDLVFKKIFGDHPHLLKSFLKAINYFYFKKFAIFTYRKTPFLVHGTSLVFKILF